MRSVEPEGVGNERWKRAVPGAEAGTDGERSGRRMSRRRRGCESGVVIHSACCTRVSVVRIQL